jgi:cyclophilin family peptidyl-prolyl cis-trans isomerase
MVDGGGEIRILLRADEAPKTVAHFKKLAQEGFYNDTTFHLVVPGFIIQGGDPNSKNQLPADDGFGGPGYTIPDEPNDLTHARGTVSMARPPDKPDSAGSQFFIVLADQGPAGEKWSETLDGTYTAFGTVIAGMDVVDRISQVPRGHSGFPAQEGRPDVDQKIGSIRIEPAPAGS